MINLLIIILKVVFLLGFLVFIHEGGHFLIAKLCHVKVYEFSLGYGHILWKKQYKETLYSLRLVPLGGFVRMEKEGEDILDSSYEKASPIKRVLILLAGGTVNIVFGILIYFILMASIGNFTTTKIDKVLDNYNAKGILMPNDKIIAINDIKVRTKDDLNDELQKNGDSKAKILILRDNQKKEIEITPNKIANKSIGIYLSATSDEPEIVSIGNNSPAQKANIQVGDKILFVEGIDVSNDIYKCMETINNTNNDKIECVILRNGQKINVTIVPDIYYTYVLGVSLKQAPSTLGNKIYFGIISTKEYLENLKTSIVQLFKRNVSINDFTGPVGIGKIISKTQSIESYIYILSVVSISLGFTNLLPIPPLDGGKILIIILETIRKKRFDIEKVAKIETIVFAILIAFSIYITYNDILKII